MTLGSNLARTTSSAPNDLEAFWMPFTASRAFKKRPRMVSRAKDMHYFTPEGRSILDATAGMWCTNAWHNRDPIVAAIKNQAEELDYAPPFQFAHPKSFQLASRIAELAPSDLDHVFFTNSGSEAVDTALKMALAYWNVSGQGSRTRLIGRERGYHGVGFGGISVGGISNNRRLFGSMLPGVDHLPHTYDRERQGFSRGQPEWGGHLADELERIVALHDASTIAAVIVEPLAGSTGVLVPPKGYLERLRAICDRHGILLIFDEVITGFGRLGASFAVDRFGVVPDLVTCAKGLTNGTVPMAAVIARRFVYDAFMSGPELAVEFPHGYTYSGHPLAVAAALATMDIYVREDLFARARALEPYWEDAVHSLKGLPHVVDLRNLGLVAGIELAPIAGKPAARGFDVFLRCLEKGLLVRTTGDIVALSPPLVITRAQIDELFGILAGVLKDVA